MSRLLSMYMEEIYWGHSTCGIQKVTFLLYAWFGGQEEIEIPLLALKLTIFLSFVISLPFFSIFPFFLSFFFLSFFPSSRHSSPCVLPSSADQILKFHNAVPEKSAFALSPFPARAALVDKE